MASLASLLYVVVHIAGSRRRYTITQHGPPWLYGNHIHAAALLLSRAAVGLWIAAIVTTSLLVSTFGIRLNASLSQQTVYLDLVVCAIGL